MRPSTSLKYITLVLSIFTIKLSHAQELEKKDPPPFKRNRAEENYEYLNERNVYKSVVGDKFKLLSIADNIFVNIGGQYRPRLEHFTNENWTEEDATFYSQRLSLFTSLNFGQTIRLYGEMIHGYTSNEDQVVESDEIDIHQGFIEINLLLTDSARLSFRLGRQEINLGSSRLISIREGPNIKRSFDVVQAIYSVGITQIRTFYGKEVSPRFGAFDNEFNLFDSESLNPEVWTVDVRFPIRKIIGTNELYYIGFKSKMSRFADAIGREVRHTLGIRRYGMLWNRMSYNTEIAYQFGEIENKTIRAINIELDNKYHFEHWRWKPQLGLKVDVSTGDRTTGDGRINTFNPLFVNPALYSLAAVNTPANLTSLHPNLTLFPVERLMIYIDYSLFYRTSKQDGLYAPPRFLVRESSNTSSKKIGNVLGFKVKYEINHNLEFESTSSYFSPGGFIKETGDSESTFYFSSTVSFKF